MFFQDKALGEVGATLGISADAARMRVNRSLEKLHSILRIRGVTISLAAVGTALATEAISAPPTGLAAAIASMALASTPVAGGTAATLLKILAMTKLKSGIITAIVVAGLATPLLIQQHQAQAKLRKENESLQQQVARLQADNETISNRPSSASSPVADSQQNDLLRLRNEVAMLRRQTNELAKGAQENRRLKTSLANASPEKNEPESSDAEPFRSQVHALVNFDETLITGGWKTGPDRRTLVFVKPELGTTDDGKQTVTLHSVGIEVPNSLLATHGLGAVATESNQTEQHGQLSPSTAADALLKQLAAEPNTQQFRIGNIATFPGQSAQLQIGSAGDGINFTATPNLAADGKGFDLRFDTVLSPTQNRQGTH